METIPFDLLHSWWGGKVKVRKMKPFEDGRGLLGEIFRQDSDTFGKIVNTYISETNSFIKRGSHEHQFQDDEFITWNSRMVYEFYNPETKEVKFFITDLKGIYSLYVEHGIHHGYRNLDYQNISYTLNSLNKLYKGYDRNEEPDEIRHEKKTVDNKILFIFGAGGKLGSALTEVAYREMGEHTFEIVPCFDKLLKVDDVNKFFETLDYAFPGKELTFVNCAALTNTKDSGPLNAEWRWSNVNLPHLFTNKCAERNWKFVQLSTDYVYQEVKKGIVNFYVSTYTQSKKEMESILNQINGIHNLSTTVLRVSNLFSQSVDDVNVFTRLQKIIDEKGGITVDPELEIAPTDVDKLSLKIVNLFKEGFFNVNGIKYVNVITPSFKVDEFVYKFLNTKDKVVVRESGKLNPWLNSFKNDQKATKINLD